MGGKAALESDVRVITQKMHYLKTMQVMSLSQLVHSHLDLFGGILHHMIMI